MEKERNFRDLIFPPRCQGCGSLSQGLCLACRSVWNLGRRLTYVGQIPIYSSLQYSSSVARILLASKEDGVKQADELVLEALIFSARQAFEYLGQSHSLVPIPSTARSGRRRGRNYMQDILEQMDQSQGIAGLNILFHTRKVRDQSSLDARARGENLMGALGIRSAGRRVPQMVPEVVLADDLLTTGSTMKEAIRTLESGGIRVLAGITAFVA